MALSVTHYKKGLIREGMAIDCASIVAMRSVSKARGGRHLRRP